MAGFSNDVMVADNVNFAGGKSATVSADGQLLIGSTASPNIKVGTLTSPDSSVSIGYSSPNITLQAGATTATTYTTDSGNAVPALNVLNILGGTGIDTSATGNTVTVTFDSSEVPSIPTSITTDSGIVTPTSNNFNLLGRSGSKVGGSGATVTVRSPPYAAVNSTGSSALNSGEFVTTAVTRTLPASGGLLDGDLVEYFCTTSSALAITANTGQTIRIGTLVTSSAGTATSTAIGDSVSLRWYAAGNLWCATSVIGTWVIA